MPVTVRGCMSVSVSIGNRVVKLIGLIMGMIGLIMGMIVGIKII
jgi:hypothetical protein